MVREAQRPGRWRRWLVRTSVPVVLILGSLGVYRLLNPEPEVGGRPVTAWIKELNHTDLAKQDKAFEAVRQLGAPAIPYLTQSPRLEDTPVKLWWQQRACPWMAQILPRSVYRKVPFRPKGGLIVGSGSARALGDMGEAATSAVPALLLWLDKEDENIRSSAACALMQINPGDPAVVRKLTQMAKSELENEMVFHNVSNEFEHLATHQAAILPLLVELVRYEQPHIRTNTIRALTLLAPQHELARTALERASKGSGQSASPLGSEPKH